MLSAELDQLGHRVWSDDPSTGTVRVRILNYLQTDHRVATDKYSRKCVIVKFHCDQLSECVQPANQINAFSGN